MTAATIDDAPSVLYELSGPPGSPVFVVLGGISSNRHVTATADNPDPGWWQALVGDGRAIDTRRVRALSFDWVDGSPVVTTHGQAKALADALDDVGIPRVAAIVGASYGGMVALAFADLFPSRVERLVVISAAHESHPMSTALRALQRRIVRLGIETGRASDALALARALAMTTYRTADEFAQRFAVAPIREEPIEFESERYLMHVGRAFAGTWRPERYLALSLSMDLHRVEPERVRTPTTLVSAIGDTLVPDSQMRELSRRLGAPNQLVRLRTSFGHDAFLTEPDAMSAILSAALQPVLP